ncbi:MAG: aminotransferase [Acidimicrobiales bacterium]|nr:aminotransferase [Acidimicrobiales bacterium]
MVKSLTPWQPSAAVRRAGSSAIRDLLELTERPELISLAGGLPNPECFPIAAIARATAAALAESGPAALQYGPTEGHRPLREWVAARHRTDVGAHADAGPDAGPGADADVDVVAHVDVDVDAHVDVDADVDVDVDVDQVIITSGAQQALDLLARSLVEPGQAVALADPDPDVDVDVDVDQVIITSGAQQALDLLARSLVEPGQAVALADPAYPGALQALRAAGAELVGIPSDDEGLCVDVLARRLAGGLRPALVYVVANFNNPTGTTLPLERRLALAELAERYDFWLIDDDPYGDLRWVGSAQPGLRTMTDRAITLGSTSKILCPGLRVGWAIAPPPVRRACTTLKQGADLHTGSLDQQIALRVLAEPGFLAGHLDRVRATYRCQAEALADALRRHLGDRIRFSSPDGGMFLWATVGPDRSGTPVDTTAMLGRALGQGVAFVPGSAFAVTPGEHRTGLRLSYATNHPDALDEAARRLAAALP